MEEKVTMTEAEKEQEEQYLKVQWVEVSRSNRGNQSRASVIMACSNHEKFEEKQMRNIQETKIEQ